MPDKKKPQAEPISFEDLGGQKVGHPVPVKTERAIDFSAIGGKVVRRASKHPMAEVKPSNETRNMG
jgi:hypothetical protein